jgi:hypothetical protein
MTKKYFEITDTHKIVSVCCVEAEDEQEAMDIAMGGDVDWEETDTSSNTNVEEVDYKDTICTTIKEKEKND